MSTPPKLFTTADVASLSGRPRFVVQQFLRRTPGYPSAGKVGRMHVFTEAQAHELAEVIRNLRRGPKPKSRPEDDAARRRRTAAQLTELLRRRPFERR